MHRWMSIIIGTGAGSAVNTAVGDDIATLAIFVISGGHALPPNVAAALARLISGLVMVASMVVTNLAMSKWGDKVLAAKV